MLEKERKEVKERFESDTKEHEMSIELDDGVHRCIFFGRPNSGYYHFRIITFPGGLTITGDMGTYTFVRTRDMFEFFPMGEHDFNHKYIINPRYWAEKLQNAADVTEFDSDSLNLAIEDWFEGGYLKEEQREAVNEWLGWNVCESIESVRDFADEFEIDDWWDRGYDKFTYHYIWCCYAIVWAINRYKIKRGHPKNNA